jgi:hypothetical protein
VEQASEPSALMHVISLVFPSTVSKVVYSNNLLPPAAVVERTEVILIVTALQAISAFKRNLTYPGVKLSTYLIVAFLFKPLPVYQTSLPVK